MKPRNNSGRVLRYGHICYAPKNATLEDEALEMINSHAMNTRTTQSQFFIDLEIIAFKDKHRHLSWQSNLATQN